MKKKLTSQAVQITGVLLLSVVLLAFFFRGTDVASIRDALLSASPKLIAAAIALTMVTYALRALRWQGLMVPIGTASFANCFATTVLGFTVNFLVPGGRVGEIARPYLLAKRESFPVSSTLATVLLERVLDLVTVVLLMGFALLFGDLSRQRSDAVASVRVGGVLGFGGAVAALLVMAFFARYPGRALEICKWMFRVLPAMWQDSANRMAATFATGLRVLVDGAGLFKAAALSILLWLNIAVGVWLGARALGAYFAYTSTFVVIGFLTVGVAVPTPGGIGGYHVMSALAMTSLLGIDASVAKAVALVNHAISFLPVTFIGIILFAKAGLSFRQVKSMK